MKGKGDARWTHHFFEEACKARSCCVRAEGPLLPQAPFEAIALPGAFGFCVQTFCGLT